ncbi:hypothetical protein STEG23_034039 [Scotinomys teguina]
MRGAAWAARRRAGQQWPRSPGPGPGPPPLLPPPRLLLLLLLLGGASAQYSSDLCNWKGSGLTREAHSKEVEQVYLRCSAGSVEWMYPTGALIVNLRPNTFSSARNLTVCIKPFRDSSGANIYLEKTGELRLLVRDISGAPGQVQCFSLEQGGLFVEATPQQDISRRTTGFQYELMSGQRGLDLHVLSAPCRPCSDTEVLLAICTSDFVVRGFIQDVTHVPEQQASVIYLRVLLVQLLRQAEGETDMASILLLQNQERAQTDSMSTDTRRVDLKSFSKADPEDLGQAHSEGPDKTTRVYKSGDHSLGCIRPSGQWKGQESPSPCSNLSSEGLVWFSPILATPIMVSKRMGRYEHLIFDKEAKNIKWKKESIFNKWCWHNWMSTFRRLQIDPYLFVSPCTKLKSKWIKDLNINPVTLNLIEEKVGSTLEHIGTGDHFLNITPIAQTLSATINQWDHMKLRSFCRAKDTVTKTKHQSTEWEKIFTNPTSDRGLIYRIYKELKKQDIKTPNSPIKKWAIELNRELPTEESQMAERHLRNCSTLLVIREMQIKTTLRYHLTPVRMAKIKTLRTVHVGENVEQEEHSSTVGGNANWYNYSGNQYGGFSENWELYFLKTKLLKESSLSAQLPPSTNQHPLFID